AWMAYARLRRSWRPFCQVRLLSLGVRLWCYEVRDGLREQAAEPRFPLPVLQAKAVRRSVRREGGPPDDHRGARTSDGRADRQADVQGAIREPAGGLGVDPRTGLPDQPQEARDLQRRQWAQQPRLLREGAGEVVGLGNL